MVRVPRHEDSRHVVARPGRPVLVHDIEHCRAALAAAGAAGRAVTLRSAPGAAAWLGPLLFKSMVDAARAEFPDAAADAVLDCGRAPGLALAALRAGIDAVRLDAPKPVRDKVADIAGRCGARLDRDRRRPLDLLDLPEPEAACRVRLSGPDRNRSGGKRPPASERDGARRVEKSAPLG